MKRDLRHEVCSTVSPGHATGRVEDFAAELTEAAFSVALRRGTGTDWLDKKLELWKAMTRTVNRWEQETDQPLWR
jgi:hypothetical protein